MKDIESIKNLIKEHISLGELLKIDGRITNLLEEEQFSCPFHGVDRKKSSRYYRATDTAYCWVCKEKWDAISYIQKKEGTGYTETLNRILKEYQIDISALPEATEEHVKKLQEKTVPKVDNRKLALESIYQAIVIVRDEIDPNIYHKFVYAYMILKYVIPDEKFSEQFAIVKNGIKKVFEKLKG